MFVFITQIYHDARSTECEIRQISMFPVGFEPITSANERPQTHAFARPLRPANCVTDSELLNITVDTRDTFLFCGEEFKKMFESVRNGSICWKKLGSYVNINMR